MAEVGKRALLAGSWMDAENKIYFPSGVNVEGISPVEWVVSRWAVPPSAGITNTSKLPYLSLAKAICLPSGDHTGGRFVRLLRGELCGRTAFCGNFVDVSLVTENDFRAVG